MGRTVSTRIAALIVSMVMAASLVLFAKPASAEATELHTAQLDAERNDSSYVAPKTTGFELATQGSQRTIYVISKIRKSGNDDTVRLAYRNGLLAQITKGGSFYPLKTKFSYAGTAVDTFTWGNDLNLATDTREGKYTYDKQGRLVSIKDWLAANPTSTAWEWHEYRFTYDNRGRVANERYLRNDTVYETYKYKYDEKNRVSAVKVSFPWDSHDISKTLKFAYCLKGNPDGVCRR